MAKDPVCGMTVDEDSSLKINKEGKDYFFCSGNCRDKFLKKPLFKNRLFLVTALVVVLIAASYFFPILEPFRKAFLMYLSKIWWAVLLGLALGGLIDYYIPR